MFLIDSNILIYLRDPRYSETIVKQIGAIRIHTCNVIVAEVLGYKHLEDSDKKEFEDLFAAMKNLVFDTSVTEKVIDLRRRHTIQLPDAIVAATAIVHDLVLWTHNTEDFKNIKELKVFDPIAKL